MSTFGFYQDAPYKIFSEGREITLKLQKTSPTTANVVWTLPKGAPGCSIEDLEYNGIIVVVDNVPIKIAQSPTNGTYYTADPTVNRNLHAGDKIGTGLVVGAFYDDKSTTTLELTGLEPNTPYYVAGFAVNNVCNYHTEGVHSYSQDYQEGGEPNGPACQQIQFGVQVTDPTGLNPTQLYSFSVTLNGVQHTITVNGSNAQTFQELIDSLNYTFATIDGPFLGATPPGYGTLYVNQTTNEVFVWDGTKNNIQSAIIGDITPTSPVAGDYWVDNDDSILYRWDGSSWVQQNVITYNYNPLTPDCGTIWYNGTTAYEWDGNVWRSIPTFKSAINPVASPTLPCGMYWLNTKTNAMYRWEASNISCVAGELTEGRWVQVDVLVWSDDPRLIEDGYFWYDTSTNKLTIRDMDNWRPVSVNVINSTTVPTSKYITGTVWVNTEEETIFEWNGINWDEIFYVVFWSSDPTKPASGDLYFDPASDKLFTWDVVGQQWKQVVNLEESATNPAGNAVIETSSVWVNGEIVKRWDGMQWVDVCAILSSNDPTTLINGSYWHDTLNNAWNVKTVTGWVSLNYIKYETTPSSVSVGQYWFNPSTSTLSVWNGIAWISLMFSPVPIMNAVDSLWYNTVERVLYKWNGSAWIVEPTTHVNIDETGHLVFTTGSTGSGSNISIVDDLAPAGLFASLTPAGRIQRAQPGTDGLLPTPSYNQLGVGTDGSSEERREMAEAILIQLGYPTVQVELSKQQIEFCIDQGLQTLRRMGSAGYERVFFFLNLKGGQQHYKMTDRTVGFHKIVNIMGIHRMTSAFLGTAEGQGVYGQLVLQHLYQMGTFDLVSYHIINEYIELMEKLFAANIMYTWREKTRMLSLQQNIWKDERVLVDATIERTEQDILSDRFLNNWIQTWATAEACMILAEIRGKYATLPGAGGGVTLNAGDLRSRAERGFQQCVDDLDNYIANSNIEDLGMNTQFIMG
mgnify:CR=1 FL=1